METSIPWGGVISPIKEVISEILQKLHHFDSERDEKKRLSEIQKLAVLCMCLQNSIKALGAARSEITDLTSFVSVIQSTLSQLMKNISRIRQERAMTEYRCEDIKRNCQDEIANNEEKSGPCDAPEENEDAEINHLVVKRDRLHARVREKHKEREGVMAEHKRFVEDLQMRQEADSRQLMECFLKMLSNTASVNVGELMEDTRRSQL